MQIKLLQATWYVLGLTVSVCPMLRWLCRGPEQCWEMLLGEVHSILVAALPEPKQLKFSPPSPFLAAEVVSTHSKPWAWERVFLHSPLLPPNSWSQLCASLFPNFPWLFFSCLLLFPPPPPLAWLWSQFHGCSFLPGLFPLFSWHLSYLKPSGLSLFL